jgi:hypothetical protein
MTKEKVVNMWDEMENEKENLGDELPIKMNDKVFDIGIKFIDLDEVQDINEEYEEKMPPKPVIKLENGQEIRVPNDDERYEAFNDHPKAQEYEKEIKPIEKERIYRLAYEFIEDEIKPSDDVEEGINRLMKAMRYSDAIKIVNKGMELLNFKDQLDEAEKNS